MALLEEHPLAALFSARSDVIDAEGRLESTLATAIPLRSPGYIVPEAVARILMQDDNWLTGNTTLYRRSPLIAARGFAPELGSFCDGYVSRLLAARHGASFSPEVLGAWRRHAGGFAWAQTADFVRARQLATAVERRMAADAPAFPPGYPRRWAGRHLFGARRFALIRKREEARSRGVAATLWTRLYEVAMTPWLFIVYRPRDAVAVARRWFSVWRHRVRDAR
jgi:hypothetical protein